MNNKLVVPARLEKAARELLSNMTILKGCSQEVKEVIAMAVKQNCLTCYHKGDGIKGDGGYVIGNDLAIAYCLPDDIEIVVQEESKVPQWVKDRFVVCDVKSAGHSFQIAYPDTPDTSFLTGLPAALRCDGWEFKGWLHEGNDLIKASPSIFRDSDDSFWTDMSECQDERGCSVSTAYASVWQKVGK